MLFFLCHNSCDSGCEFDRESADFVCMKSHEESNAEPEPEISSLEPEPKNESPEPEPGTAAEPEPNSEVRESLFYSS